MRVGEGAYVTEHDHEFVAAKAGHGVFLARRRQQALGNRFQYFLATSVAIGIVDRLETVQVEVQDGRLVMPAIGMLQGSFNAVFQQAPVGQPGQWVVQRECLLRQAVLGQFAVQQAHLKHVVNALVHFEQVKRFADEVARARFKCGNLEAWLGGQGQHRQVAVLFNFFQTLHDLKAVQAGHLQVEQDQIVIVLAVQRAHLFGQHGRTDAGVADVAQNRFQQFNIGGQIVNDQNLSAQDVFTVRHGGSRSVGTVGAWRLKRVAGSPECAFCYGKSCHLRQ